MDMNCGKILSTDFLPKSSKEPQRIAKSNFQDLFSNKIGKMGRRRLWMTPKEENSDHFLLVFKVVIETASLNFKP